MGPDGTRPEGLKGFLEPDGTRSRSLKGVLGARWREISRFEKMLGAPAGPRRAQGLGSVDEEGLGAPWLSRASYFLRVYGPRKVGGGPSGCPAEVPRVCEIRASARRAASSKVPEVCEASVARCPRRAFPEGFPKVCEVRCVEKKVSEVCEASPARRPLGTVTSATVAA